MKDRINGIKDLDTRILELKVREKNQQADLRTTFDETVESLSPKNLIKSSLKSAVSNPNLRNTLVDTAIGLGAGIVGKKLFVGKSSNLIKKIGGTAIEFLLTNIIRKKIPQLRKKKNELADEAEAPV